MNIVKKQLQCQKDQSIKSFQSCKKVRDFIGKLALDWEANLFINKTSQKIVQIHQTAFRYQITINIELAATSLHAKSGFPSRIQAVKLQFLPPSLFMFCMLVLWIMKLLKRPYIIFSWKPIFLQKNEKISLKLILIVLLKGKTFMFLLFQWRKGKKIFHALCNLTHALWQTFRSDQAYTSKFFRLAYADLGKGCSTRFRALRALKRSFRKYSSYSEKIE